MLEPYIKNYWILDSGNRNYSTFMQRIFPHGCMELIIFYHDTFSLCDNKNLINKLENSLLIGQGTTYFDLTPCGKVGIFSIIFKPHGAGMFFPLPMNKVGDHLISLSDIIGIEASELEEKIAESSTLNEKVRVVEEFLTKKLIQKKIYDYKRLRESIKRINNNFGNASLKELSEATCLSPKQFERKFHEFVGLKPKQFMKTIRFQGALYRKQLYPKINLTQLAYDCGYYDQAHLTNDFKSFTGIAPKKYFSQNQAYSDYFQHSVL